MPLDIGIGLILGVLLNEYSSLPMNMCLAVGVTAVLLPDMDYIWKLFRTRKLPNSDHRDLLHYPLLFVPLAGLVGLMISPLIGLFLALGALLHFIHDSVGIGFGVKWLYPFKKNSYLFLFQTSTPANNDMPSQLVYSWTDEERAEMIKKYGYAGWIRHIYLRPHPWGIFEYSVLLIGVAIVIIKAT